MVNKTYVYDIKFETDNSDNATFVTEGNIIKMKSNCPEKFYSAFEALLGGVRNYIPNSFRSGYFGISHCGRKQFSISFNKDGVISWRGDIMFNNISLYSVFKDTVVESRYLPDKRVRGGAYKCIYELSDHYSFNELGVRLKIFLGVFNPELKKMGLQFRIDTSGLSLIEISSDKPLPIDSLSNEKYTILQVAISVLTTKSDFYAVLFNDEFRMSQDTVGLVKALSVLIGNSGVLIMSDEG